MDTNPEQPPTIEECRALLDPHRKRTIRRFLEAPATRETPDPHELESAFWDVVYHETPACSATVARIVERELEQSERTVGEVLDGWRPDSMIHLAQREPR